MTPHPWLLPFLDALRGPARGVLAVAARQVGVEAGTVYRLVKTDSDFSAAVEEAQAEAWDLLEAAAAHRATVGVAEPLTYQGQFTYLRDYDAIDAETGKRVEPLKAPVKLDPEGNPVIATVNKPSDALLQFLLKGYRKKFSTERTEITGADGGAVQMDDTARAARIAAILDLATKRKAENDATGGYA